MELAPDLSSGAVAAALPDRAVRSYPAMLSTEADAMAWARAGAPAGAVVVAGYQASPRGRAGMEWRCQPGRGLGFSMVLRPDLPATREGWLYLVAGAALADVVGPDAGLHWPDEVHGHGGRAAAVGVHAELADDRVDWATLTVLVDDAAPPRAPLLAEVVAAVERRLADPVEAVLDDCTLRCATLGRRVAARLVPMGPSGVVVEGEAVALRDDGSLVIATAQGPSGTRRVAVPPPTLGVLDVQPG